MAPVVWQDQCCRGRVSVRNSASLFDKLDSIISRYIDSLYLLICNIFAYIQLLKSIMLQLSAVQQLDKKLSPWRSLPHSRPSGGWLRAIRQTLGMTTRQLAKSAKVTQAAVASVERTEARDDITLTTLQRYATALDCEVVYALIPKRPLQEVVYQRADRVARDQVARVSHSMALKNQSTNNEHWERQIAELRRKLLEGKRSRLWQ